jgi:O-antigen ligase
LTDLAPVLVAMAIVALVGCVALARRPRVAVAVLVLFDIANLNGVIDRLVGVSLFWPLFAVGLTSIVVLARRGELRGTWSPVLTLGLLVLAVSGLAFSVNPIRDGQWSVMLDRVASFAFFGIVYVLLVSTRAWRLVAWTVVAGLGAVCLLTLFHAVVLHGQGDLFGFSRVTVTYTGGAAVKRHGGTSADVNFWGRALLLWTPLALSAFAMTRGRRRWLWLGTFGCLVAGIYLTQSRGAFLAIVPACICWFALAGRRYLRVLAYAPVALLVILPVTGAWSRLATISSIESTTGGADQSLVDRARQQRAGLEMFFDSPVLGQGTGAYKAQFSTFDRYSDEYQAIPNPAGAHNFFIEQLAEGGILGFTAWVLLLGSAVFVSARTMIVCRGRGEVKDGLFAVGIVAGLAGWMVASLFLHLSDLRALLAIVAIAAALDADVRHRRPVSRPAEPARATGGPARLALAAIVAASVIAAMVGASAMLRPAGTTWEASVVTPVATRPGPIDPTASWANDLITRGQLASTFVAYLERRDLVGQAGASAGVDPGDTEVVLTLPKSEGSVGIVVRGTDQDAVTALTPAVLARAGAEIDELGTPFLLDTPARATVDRVAPNSLVGPGLAVAGGLGLLAALVWWARRYRARSERGAAPAKAPAALRA